MTCGGCERAVRGVLKSVQGRFFFRFFFLKIPIIFIRLHSRFLSPDRTRFASRLIFFFSGIEKVDVDLATKRVVVTGSATAEEILAAIKKTGKACELVQGA